MNVENNLRQRFGQAGTDVVMQPASVAAVKRRARQRTRRARLATGAAVLSVAAIAGTALISRDGPAAEQIQTVDNAPADQVDQVDQVLRVDESLGERADESVDESIQRADESVDPVDESGDQAHDDADAAEQTAPADDGSQDRDQASEDQPSTDEPEPESTEITGVLTEADFSYVGAFRAPADVGEPGFGFGGRASAFNPGGDPGSDDGFDGSLFLTGLARNELVAEISIPAPVPFTGRVDRLPIARVLQPLADVTGGRGHDYVGSTTRGGQDDFRIGGLEVVDGPNGPRLHWTAWQYFNVGYNDVPGHGHSSLDLSNPDPQGPWYLDRFPTYRTAGYLLSVPEPFASEHLGGRSLLAGFQAGPPTAETSAGPPFFAFDPPLAAAPESRLEVQELVGYANLVSDPRPGSGSERPLAGYRADGLTPGAAWLIGPDGSQAVVTVGNQLTVESGCDLDNGSDRSRFGPRASFYHPADLAAVADGQSEPWQVEPFRVWDPSRYLVPACGLQLTSISFDRDAGRLYLVQVQADTDQREFEPVPIIHVFELQ